MIIKGFILFLVASLPLLPLNADEELPDLTDPHVPAPAPISDEEFEIRPKLIIHIDAKSTIKLGSEEFSSQQMDAVFSAVSKIDQKTVIVVTGPSSKALITSGSKLLRAAAKWGITEARFRPTAH